MDDNEVVWVELRRDRRCECCELSTGAKVCMARCAASRNPKAPAASERLLRGADFV